MVGETIPARGLREMVRAVDFDDYSGVRLIDEAKAAGDAVGLDAGDWLPYRDAIVGGGKRTFTAKVARAAAGGTTLQVRIDDPVTGPLLGTVQVTSTGAVTPTARSAPRSPVLPATATSTRCPPESCA